MVRARRHRSISPRSTDPDRESLQPICAIAIRRFPKRNSWPPWRSAPAAACFATSTTSTSAAKISSFDPLEYLAALPGEAIGEFHLAGHQDNRRRRPDDADRRSWQHRGRSCMGAARRGAASLWPTSDAGRMGLAVCRRSMSLVAEADKADALMKSLYPESQTMSNRVPLTLQCGVGRAMLGERRGIDRLGHPGRRARSRPRLQIYRNHYNTSLSEALKAIYPVVCRLVDRAFLRLCRERIHQGLAAAPGLPVRVWRSNCRNSWQIFRRVQQLVYLADVARLEWLINVALHSPARTANRRRIWPISAIDAAQYPRLIFALQPSLRFIESPWPIDRIWHANRPGADRRGRRRPCRRRMSSGDPPIWARKSSSGRSRPANSRCAARCHKGQHAGGGR